MNRYWSAVRHARSHTGRGAWWLITFMACAPVLDTPPAPSTFAAESPSSAPVTAIVGATVIDGTGAPPLTDATVVLQGRRIQAVGPRRAVQVPADAAVIDGRGLFVLPGFVDAGAYLSPPDRSLPWDTTYVPAIPKLSQGEPRRTDAGSLDTVIARRAAAALPYGVTMVRSHGVLRSLRAVRDSIRAGRLQGPRLLITGYTVGGFELGAEILPDSIRPRLGQYFDQRIDFLKYAGTTMAFSDDNTPADEYAAGPPLLVFSEETQGAIVAVAHERGAPVEAHANSPEGLRLILEAGVDLVAHPEMMLNDYVLPDDLVQSFVRQKVTCMLLPRASTAADHRSAGTNARKLIQRGCPVAVMSGTRPGVETLRAIEALVTLGMTPMQALVAATRQGARASKMLDEVGTVTSGKLADLVVLRANPLQDIKHIERIAMVFAEGVRVPEPATP